MRLNQRPSNQISKNAKSQPKKNLKGIVHSRLFCTTNQPSSRKNETPERICQLFKKFLSCNPCKQAKQVSGKQPEEWLRQYIKIVLKSQEERNNIIIGEIRKHQMKNNKCVPKPSLFGIYMCWGCFAFLHAVSLSTMKDLKKLAQNGEEFWQHQGKSQALHSAPKKKAIMSFILDLQTNLGICSCPIQFIMFIS
jgi:hypothetical protein